MGATDFQLGELYVAEWRTMRAAQMSGYCMAGGRMDTTSLSTLAVCCDDCVISSSRFDSSMWHASSFSRSLMRCRRLCISLSISASRCELRAISCRVSSAPAVSARFAAVAPASGASRARTTALSACITRRAPSHQPAVLWNVRGVAHTLARAWWLGGRVEGRKEKRGCALVNAMGNREKMREMKWKGNVCRKANA